MTQDAVISSSKKLSFNDFKEEVLNDYRIARISRECSLLGRREVLTGKAKFGIFGDGKEIPQLALAKAFKKGNRLQDILTSSMQEGKTGNEILLSSLNRAKKEGLRPSIYTHPLGKYGHSAGTTIGMWDSQGGVPFNGDYSLQMKLLKLSLGKEGSISCSEKKERRSMSKHLLSR